MIYVANSCLHIVHLALIAFTLVGWLIPPFRVVHLVLCVLTLLSWFLSGPLLGQPGKCVVTLLQSRVWKQMGATHADQDYMPYLLEKVSGRRFSEKRIEVATQVSLYVVIVLGAIVTFTNL